MKISAWIDIILWLSGIVAILSSQNSFALLLWGWPIGRYIGNCLTILTE